MLDRLGIGLKLALASVLLLLLAGFTVERLAASELEEAMLERIEVDLSSKLRLFEDAAAQVAERGAEGGAAWDAFADAFGRSAEARVTIIAPDGSVLGDSEVGQGELARLENHNGREEVVTARERGEGSAIRRSPTLGVRMVYVARRYMTPQHGIGVLRIAVPLTSIDHAIAKSRRLILLGTSIAITIAIAISVLGTYLLTRPVRELTKHALSLSAGHLELRATVKGDDETARLARALNHLSNELAGTIRELRSERDLLAGILDGMGEGVLVLDADGGIVLANRALRSMAMLGQDAIGKSVLETIRSADLHQALARARKDERGTVCEIELGGILPRRLLVRVSRLLSDEHGLIAVFHDVTDLRRLETIRTDFVANVSHELRTPVTAISTAAETLLQGALDDRVEAADFVDVIDRHAKRLRQLVDDLLDLSKIEAKNFRLKVVETDIRPVVDHVVSLMGEPARKRGVTVEVVHAPDLPRARVDRRAVEQGVMNLLDNAIKYAGEGAHVRIATSVQQDRVEITVSDDGPGIPPQHLGRIFERFYRVDTGRSREVGGTGLGLSIVKHLAEQMKGSIEVQSTLGKGTTFTIALPRG